MIISLIICACSGIFLAMLLFGKKSELQGGRQLIRVGTPALDQSLEEYYQRQRDFIHSIDREYISQTLHQVAEKVEQWGLNVLDRVINKFGRAKDMVSGKDLPKNRGAVSFFLKHIESHKKDLNLKKTAIQIEESEAKVEKEVDKVALQVKMDQIEEIFEPLKR